MRKYLTFIGLLAAAALLPGVATAKEIAVSLTKSQVATVCNGAMYCEKSCGLNGQNTCTFGCGSKGCSGMCQNCASRTTASGAVHGVVGGTLSNTGSTATSASITRKIDKPSTKLFQNAAGGGLSTTKPLTATSSGPLGGGGAAGSGGNTATRVNQGVTH